MNKNQISLVALLMATFPMLGCDETFNDPMGNTPANAPVVDPQVEPGTNVDVGVGQPDTRVTPNDGVNVDVD